MRVLAIAFLLLRAGLYSADMNWVQNGDFSVTGGWEGKLHVEDGPYGKAAVLENETRQWTALSQTIDLPRPLPPSLEVSAWMKQENVKKGDKSWEEARITVVFYGAEGKRVGDWPAVVVEEEGSHDWAYYSNQYSVPKGATKVEITLMLDLCTGKAWYSRLNALFYDYDESMLAPGSGANPQKKTAMAKAVENWLLNPGFESPGSRDWAMGHCVSGGHDSPHSLYVQSVDRSGKLANQVVSFKGSHPVTVLLGGWMKCKGVKPGVENYMMARIDCDFRDAGNIQKGGWQALAAAAAGDSPWTWYEKAYKVPEGSEQIQVNAGLVNSAGEAWFDDISLKLLDAQGKALTTVLSDRQVSDTSDWWAYSPPSEPSGTALDLSFLNDKPAGTHGFVSAQSGHFMFDDSTRARFWGSDFVGPNHFLSHADADAVALRLARLGVNLIRLHMPDAAWSESNLFDPKSDNTLSFMPSQVEKLDYLLAAFKKNGIYVYPDWIVARRFRKGDGVMDAEWLDDGAKGAIHFDRRIIALTQKYAAELLSHVNPYTGLALKDDPIYVGSEIVNESSIFSGFDEQKLPESYWAELQGLYKAWGGKGMMTRFKFDGESHRLRAVKNPENADASLRFLYAEVAKSNLEMKAFQKTLSPHALLAGSNMGLPLLGDIKSNALLDYMDTHAYWDHPQIWNVEGGWGNAAIAPFTNNSQLHQPFGESLLCSLAQAPVLGKPLIVTEWNDCFPNEHRLEGPVLMASYACLQDWDGMLQFDYAPEKPGLKPMSNFSISTRPDNEPLFQAGALIFRQALLKPSEITVLEPVSDKALYKNGMSSPWLFDNPWLPYVVKVAKKFSGPAEEPADPKLASAAKFHQVADKILTSSTGEEQLDYGKGILKLESDCVQGFTGGIGTGLEMRTRDLGMKLDTRNPWASVLAVSLDKKPLSGSERVILFAVARAENSGQIYNATRTALKAQGEAPILMQGVAGEISLRVAIGRYRIISLDSNGRAGNEIKHVMETGVVTSSNSRSWLKFKISMHDRTCYYLIQRIRVVD